MERLSKDVFVLKERSSVVCKNKLVIVLIVLINW